MSADSRPDPYDPKALRKEAGTQLRRWRKAAGLTQREVAKALDFRYYAQVAQIEAGKSRLPTDRLAPAAALLGVPPETLAKTLTRYYDPHLWDILWGSGTLGPED